MTKLALLVVFAVFIVITIIVWIIHLIRHKKKAALAVISCLTVFVISFCVIFPTSFPFVDSWIIGKTLDEIEAVYGDNYELGETKSGNVILYPVWKKWTNEGLQTDYYRIYFDKNEKAVRAGTYVIYELGYRCGGVSSY